MSITITDETTCPSWCSRDAGHPYTHIHPVGVAHGIHVHVTCSTVPYLEDATWVMMVMPDSALRLVEDDASAQAELLECAGRTTLAGLVRKAAGIAADDHNPQGGRVNRQPERELAGIHAQLAQVAVFLGAGSPGPWSDLSTEDRNTILLALADARNYRDNRSLLCKNCIQWRAGDHGDNCPNHAGDDSRARAYGALLERLGSET